MTRTRCRRCGGEISYADVLSLPQVTRPIRDGCRHDWRIVTEDAPAEAVGAPLFSGRLTHTSAADLLAPWARFLVGLEAAGKL